ncbi:MAG TPA: ferritin [Chitinophagales bacterium]|nr:ferritin [Chitinophagales bacterium]HRK28833.1 ferritin [Chitinophagales bacterium]
MLSAKVLAALNQQVSMEANASQKYLAMACWCDANALEGCARFFYRHADEERMHMLKLVHYINDAGGAVTVPGVELPPADFGNVKQLFETAYGHEQKVSASIDNLIELCTEQKDKQTANFLQWYLNEQHEEEALYRTLIDRIKLIGIEGRGLYFIDKEVDEINTKKQAAEAAE